MFVGRIEDLAFLQEQYEAEKFSFIPIYGRRRVGKTSLIQQHIKNKTAIYFQAFEEKAELNLERLSNELNQIIFGKVGENLPSYTSLSNALQAFTDFSQKEKCILIIDEYPYLAKSMPEVNSIFQYFIDHHWKENGNIQLILCGSSMSFMLHQVLGYKSPLYGRKTGQIKLRAFTFKETLEYFSESNPQEVVGYYGLTGGIPQYMEQIDPEKHLAENIQQMFLTTTSLLFEEPQNLLKQELDDPTNYNSILFAIANGYSKMSEISSKTTIPTSNLTRFLDNLIDLEIVERKRPAGEPNSKRTVYHLKDTMFRFWFRFVSPNLSAIEIRTINGVLSLIEEQFSDFLDAVFKDICIEYLWEEMKQENLSQEYRDFSSWWGNNPIARRQEEIDIVGLDSHNEKYLFAECKWRNQKTDIKVLERLIDRASLFPQDRELYVFSKAPFTAEAQQFAFDQNICLVVFDDMY